MEGIPDLCIPTVLSFLRSRDICKCACIAKEWASCVQERLTKMKEKAARARAQISDKDKRRVDQRLLNAAKGGNVDQVETAIAHGADIETRINCQSTPLLLASRNGHLSVVEALIAQGANIETQNGRGTTPLMYASRNGYRPVVKVLIARQANLDVENCFNQTALILAARDNRFRVVTILISSGANLDIRDSNGLTALEYAVYKSHLEIAEALNTAGIPTEQLARAALTKNTLPSTRCEGTNVHRLVIRLSFEKALFTVCEQLEMNPLKSTRIFQEFCIQEYNNV